MGNREPFGELHEQAKLRVLLVGGIYGFPERLGVIDTPETTLERGLREVGVCVRTQAHTWHVSAAQWDIVHVHHLAKQALVQALRCAGRRLVFTRHGITPVTGFRRAALELVLRRSDAVVALSRSEEAALRPQVPAGRLVCIPNGIEQDLWAYSVRQAPSVGTPWRILFVGQLVDVKGVDVLLESIAVLVGQYHLELRLVYQNDSLLAALRQQAATLSITHALTFLGFCTPAQLQAEYQNAHVLVLASRHEALPSVVTEAMLTGLPVVATDVGGIAEQLGGDGVVVEAGDPISLRHGIAGVLENYALATARAEQAARRARDRFTIEAMVRDHLELYRRVLAAPRRAIFAEQA